MSFELTPQSSYQFFSTSCNLFFRNSFLNSSLMASSQLLSNLPINLVSRIPLLTFLNDSLSRPNLATWRPPWHVWTLIWSKKGSLYISWLYHQLHSIILSELIQLWVLKKCYYWRCYLYILLSYACSAHIYIKLKALVVFETIKILPIAIPIIIISIATVEIHI